MSAQLPWPTAVRIAWRELSAARTLMAADLSARVFAVPTPEQEADLRVWVREMANQ